MTSLLLAAALAMADPTPVAAPEVEMSLLNANLDVMFGMLDRMTDGKPLSRTGGRPMITIHMGRIPLSSVRSEVLAVMTEAGFEIRETDDATVVVVPESCSASEAPVPTTGDDRVALIACGHVPTLDQREGVAVADQLTDAGIAYETGETPGGLSVFVIR